MSATLTTPKTTSGGEIIRELVNASDGQGLHFDGAGYVNLTNAAGAEFGTSDFSLEFVLNQTGDNTNDNYIFYTHEAGDNRLYIYNDISADSIGLAFVDNSSGISTKSLSYDMSADYGTPTHYVIACDRSGNATLYKNGNSVATVDISSTSAIDLGASNTNAGLIGTGASGYAVIGTFYRFRTWNKSLSQTEVTATYENATVPFADQYGSQTIVIPGDFTGNLDGWDTSNTWNSQTNPSNNMVLAASAATQVCRTGTTLTAGKRYRCTYTATSITDAPKFVFWETASTYPPISVDTGSSTITAGTNSFEFVWPAASGNDYFYIQSGTTTAAVTLDDISVVAAGCVADYDLAFANPTQSLKVQDRSTNGVDGTASSGVTQVTPLVQVNATAARIGTSAATPADGELLVSGSITATGLVVGTASDSYSQLLINSSTTGESELRMGDTDTDAGSIAYTNSDDTMTFRAAAAARMSLSSTGLEVTGQVTASNGIAFQSATTGSGTIVSSAFTLDSYEVGTFTATLNGAVNPATLLTTVANYTKIGDRVYINIGFENIDTTGYSGAVAITGLPFANNGRRAVMTVAAYSGATWTNQLAGIIDMAATTVNFYSIASGSGWSNADHNAGTGRYFWVTGQYKTDA